MAVWVSKFGYARVKFTENAIFLLMWEWQHPRQNQDLHQEDHVNQWEQRERKNNRTVKFLKDVTAKKNQI
jgi:hypothetical protein